MELLNPTLVVTITEGRRVMLKVTHCREVPECEDAE